MLPRAFKGCAHEGKAGLTMDLAEPGERYKAIEDYRSRSLVVYATSTRANVGAMMAGDTV